MRRPPRSPVGESRVDASPHPEDTRPPSRTTQVAYAVVALTLSSLFALTLAEIGLRLAFPQESLAPRWNFSSRYCLLPFPSVRMVHERPGRWRFTYTTNADGNRGPDTAEGPFAGATVVTLGDSYTFGQGVNDGEEYPAVLARRLATSTRVVNLGVPGWGLTQEIRRYHDFGMRYRPGTVILQFSANDPEDDLRCPVTELRDGRFAFRDTEEGIFRIKSYLSRSVIQKSQVYNLFRDSIYQLFAMLTVARTRATMAPPTDAAQGPLEQRVYSDLLRHFAEELAGQGVHLIFLSVNRQLTGFPLIERTVDSLAADGRLTAVDGATWLDGTTNYGSPEGHLWGAPAQAIIGDRLAALITREGRATGPALGSNR
jgi:lysophospholipase L1-like esterase